MDGGSEFAAQFEAQCHGRGIRLFVLPPRSPKLNGQVERAHRTHTEELYEVKHLPLDMAGLNQALQAWEQVYKLIRPHQALGYLTPQQYLPKMPAGKGASVTNHLNEYSSLRFPEKCVMILA